jgi:TPP-dependent pyruvate/acetoin dehydrogenase alpha subunit
VLRRAQEQVDAATEEADKAPYPDAATLLDHVYDGAAGGGDGHGR